MYRFTFAATIYFIKYTNNRDTKIEDSPLANSVVMSAQALVSGIVPATIQSLTL